MYKPRIEVVFGNERIISPSGLNIHRRDAWLATSLWYKWRSFRMNPRIELSGSFAANEFHGFREFSNGKITVQRNG